MDKIFIVVKKRLFFVLMLLSLVTFSQNYKSYKPEREKIHDLMHTKLKVDFNFKEKQLNGEAWITAKPHFYATNKFTLDAKAMIIHQVSLNTKELEYNYDDEQIIIDLPKKYTKKEVFTVYIRYTARPEKVKQKGSAAITGATLSIPTRPHLALSAYQQYLIQQVVVSKCAKSIHTETKQEN